MKRTVFFIVLMISGMVRMIAQPHFSQHHGLYDGGSITVSITSDEGTEIRYTTDGSEPNIGSRLYTNPLQITNTTILRAVEVKDRSVSSSIATASYIFISSVLKQPNNPSGYPKQWGEYTQIWGTAEADYEMDPEMTSDKTLSQKISEGLKQIPILSIVSDKDNFFSHENDPDRGGIYIFTGPPVGDNTGHGWTRPASVELFGGPQQHDLSTDCGVRLHGGHGRLAEKNPKHSFRLVFKEKYGPKTLKYPLFGEDEPAKFDQLVLRCHFGNAWQHWMEGNRQKAQYTRDVWARRIQRKLGRTSVNALYVHLFLNGMYWGLYNLAERVDEQFGKDHIGGEKSDIDVIKIEEDGGNHIEASAGTLDAWNLMTETVTKATNEAYYQQLDTLLDIDNFIDYMIINQYAGNTDWDHHNWYAIRRHNTENKLSEGFRFLCWDSEIILENERENVLSKNNGVQSPTGIFQQLLRNDNFARRYLRRAKELLKDDGMLGQESVVAVWDSLYHTISMALYDEAARWGDYRRDVHRWQTAGQLYTVDNQFMAERNRLLTQYFPVRTGNVLNQIISYVNIDDFEMPDGWEPLMASMFHEWDGSGINAKPLDKQVKVDWNFNTDAGGGTAIAGFVNVDHNQFADLSAYDKLVLRGTGNGLRILANRLVAHGPWKQINVSFNPNDPYWDNDIQAIVLPLEDLKTAPTNEGITRNDAFVHLNALKVDWSSTVNVRGAYLIPSAESLDINRILASRNDNRYYNLQGQPVDHPTKGIYIKNGKKVVFH